MIEGKDFRKEENEDGEQLWNNLKSLPIGEKLPNDPYQYWD